MKLFHLTLPPSKNKLPTRSWQKLLRVKHQYMSQVFAEAAMQHQPDLHPPEKVWLKATFYLRNLRDEDNLARSMDWVLDAMKLTHGQTSTLRWKGHINRAWFLDDSPRHISLECSQEIDRKNPRLELEISQSGPHVGRDLGLG